MFVINNLGGWGVQSLGLIKLWSIHTEEKDLDKWRNFKLVLTVRV